MHSYEPEQLKKHNGLIKPRALVIAGIVVAAAALRILPHPINFTPVGALALFGGSYFASKRLAFLFPLFAIIAGDVFVGFHRLLPYVYASFLVSVALGLCLRRDRSAARIGLYTLAGAIQFFLVTNFALWALAIGRYPKTFDGLVSCYLAGIPFFWNTLAGDALYVSMLFGGMAFLEHRFPALRAVPLDLKFS
jgi:hypothetical protein